MATELSIDKTTPTPAPTPTPTAQVPAAPAPTPTPAQAPAAAPIQDMEQILLAKGGAIISDETEALGTFDRLKKQVVIQSWVISA